ncbi:hypothetical protein [Actinokineospora enzanensis]|uniref:hypothetical protein n=1 Tax=Actinokineospora enzanensis TaxID=155975 RepID=UPI00039BE4C7|nr:hypothetical protein [Actinokineospora enzanensis]
MAWAKDVDDEIERLSRSVTARDVRQALVSLARVGGEIGAIVSVGLGAATLAATLLPGIGLPVAGGTLALVAKKAMEGYASLDADERKQVRVIAAYVRKLHLGR